MNHKRAREIISSPTIFNVTYHGIPIYIENVNSDNETANIHPLDQPNQSQKVNLSSLVEQ